jgi:glycerate kinase
MCRAAEATGWVCDAAPVADGGEGTLEAIGGRARHTRVTGPLGEPVDAEWLMRDHTAVIEMARASGLTLAGGAEGNDPMQASTIGTGELIVAGLEAGARQVIVGLGGSASTDGGLGALRAFGRHRLHDIPGSGAAGGLAGGLAAVGAKLVPGFDVVADAIALDERIEGADVVLTGEGYLDAQSFEGKVVGGVVELGREAGVPVVAIVGEAAHDAPVPDGVDVVSLVERFGDERARTDVLTCVEEIVRERLMAQ